MAREAPAVEIATADLASAAREVARTGRARRLLDNGVTVAIISPVRPRPRRSSLTPAERLAAVLASAGSWEGIVDSEQLKRELKAARSDNRPPVSL